MLFTSIVCIAVLALSGCGDSKQITEVKALPFSYGLSYVQDPDMTVDQVLDTRKICDSVNWSVQKTDRNQVFVEYDCIYKGVSSSLFGEREKSNGGSFNIDSANDVYQWTYGSNGQPELSYVGVELHYKDGSSHSLNIRGFFSSGSMNSLKDVIIKNIMKMAVKNKVTDFDQAFSILTDQPIPVRPALPITDTTYGNTLTTLYPDQSARNAASFALWWKGVSKHTNIYGIDSLGYPMIGLGSEGDKKLLFPVNPKDVQFAIKVDSDSISEYRSSGPSHLSSNKLFCVNELCYDKTRYVVGRAPASVQAQEAAPSQPVQQTPAATTTANTTASSGYDDGWPEDTPCIVKKRKAFVKEAKAKHYASNVSIYQAQEWAAECKAQ